MRTAKQIREDLEIATDGIRDAVNDYYAAADLKHERVVLGMLAANLRAAEFEHAELVREMRRLA